MNYYMVLYSWIHKLGKHFIHIGYYLTLLIKLTGEVMKVLHHWSDNWSIANTNICIYYTLKNIKSSNKNNRFKKSTPTWIDKFELSDGSYTISDIQDCYKNVYDWNTS